jgi:hypothetical protein
MGNYKKAKKIWYKHFEKKSFKFDDFVYSAMQEFANLSNKKSPKISPSEILNISDSKETDNKVTPTDSIVKPIADELILELINSQFRY